MRKQAGSVACPPPSAFTLGCEPVFDREPSTSTSIPPPLFYGRSQLHSRFLHSLPPKWKNDMTLKNGYPSGTPAERRRRAEGNPDTRGMAGLLRGISTSLRLARGGHSHPPRRGSVASSGRGFSFRSGNIPAVSLPPGSPSLILPANTPSSIALPETSRM